MTTPTNSHKAWTDKGGHVSTPWIYVQNFRFDHHMHGLLKRFSLSQAGVDDLHRFGRFTSSQLKSAC